MCHQCFQDASESFFGGTYKWSRLFSGQSKLILYRIGKKKLKNSSKIFFTYFVKTFFQSRSFSAFDFYVWAKYCLHTYIKPSGIKKTLQTRSVTQWKTLPSLQSSFFFVNHRLYSCVSTHLLTDSSPPRSMPSVQMPSSHPSADPSPPRSMPSVQMCVL